MTARSETLFTGCSCNPFNMLVYPEGHFSLKATLLMRTTHEPARFQTAPSDSTSASLSTCAASSYIYITIITPASLHATCSLGQ